MDLTDFLPEALRDAQLSIVWESKDEAKKYNLTSLVDWTAFSSYMAVVVHLKPQRAFELPAYTSIIANWQEKAEVKHE